MKYQHCINTERLPQNVIPRMFTKDNKYGFINDEDS